MGKPHSGPKKMRLHRFCPLFVYSLRSIPHIILLRNVS